MEIGDRWSHTCACWVWAHISEIRHFSRISKLRDLDFEGKLIFWQIKIFETWTFVKVCAPLISWSCKPYWRPRWLQTAFKPYFWAFFKIQYFWYFGLFQKINYWSKWSGGNARKSFAIRSFNPAPRYSPNTCRKSHILDQKSRFFIFFKKFTYLKPHQPNRIASTKFNFVDVGDINTIILIKGHQAIWGTGSNLGHDL